MRRALLVLAPLLAAGCSDPTITIAIDWSPHPGLRDQVTEVRVTVNTLTDQACATLRDGDVDDAELALGLQAAVTFPNGASAHAIDGVPRLGPKLFVLEGYDAEHRRIAAGCRDHGDIDADVELAIVAEPVIVTRVVLTPDQSPSLTLPRTTRGGPGDRLTFYARELAAGHAALGAPARFALRTIDHPADLPFGEATLVDETTGEFGGDLPQAIPADASAAVGPVELVLRVPWPDRVQRVAAFVPAAVLAAPRTIAATETNAVRPDWAFVTAGPPDDVVAASLVEVAGQPRRIAVITERNKTLVRVGAITSTVTSEARALTGFRRPAGSTIVTLTGDGWYQVDPATPALVPLAPGPGATADELVAMPSCANPLVDAGLLVRTAAGWQGFTAPGPTPAASDEPVGALAQRLSAFWTAQPGAVLEDVLCVTLDQTAVVIAVLAVADDTGYVARYAVANIGAPTVLPFVGSVTVAIPGPNAIDLVGPVPTDTGVRAVSYRVKRDGDVPLLVPDGYVDYPLPAVPSRMIVAHANTDAYPDVLALVPFQGGVTLSLTHGAARPGDELTALVRTGLTSLTPRFVRLPLLENDDLQLVIAGDAGLVAFDMLTPAHAVAP
jgi:hypothetical protein